MKKYLEWIVVILISCILYFTIHSFFIQNYTVSGESMSPTFHNNDKVLVTPITKKLHLLKNGDVIVFHAHKDIDYIKRLIGKPGDTIEYKNDNLYINNIKVAEPYLDENKKRKVGIYLTENFDVSILKGSNNQYKIPDKKYLVLGDNRQNSIDSRSVIGLIDENTIVGSVFLRYQPFNDFNYSFYPESFTRISSLS
ncbi:signal peptidase I [Mammaliicoccus sciuri]|uniref:signal peptidase I n=1 Tax=Mammaliicoccus sciuri TaxID=1296 RepID=UPI003364EC8B